MNPRRLDWESLRDATLAVSGQLDTALGGRPVQLTRPPYSTRRTVYGFLDRQNFPGLFRNFDAANPDQHTPQRHTTTIPQQSLYLMNHPFMAEAARALAARARAVRCRDRRAPRRDPSSLPAGVSATAHE